MVIFEPLLPSNMLRKH